jgi:hypothetical protein
LQTALLTGKTSNAAWRSKPSFYTVSTQDRTMNPVLQLFMTKSMVWNHNMGGGALDPAADAGGVTAGAAEWTPA